MASSEAPSRFDVASSSTSSRRGCSSARAKQMSCRSPADMLAPPFWTSTSSMELGRRARVTTSR